MKKRILSLALAGVLCLSTAAPALAAGLDQFGKVNTYAAGQFADVPADAWYAANVQAAYELGLMTGSSAATFNPTGNLTVAEALALACRLHSTYAGKGASFAGGGVWYQPYVDYATQNGIITAGAYPDYTATATRAQFAAILAAALPDEALPAINSVQSLPDLDAAAPYAAGVLKLYNAGILTGSDAAGSFQPTATIQRAEVAAIVTRMADKSLRKTFTLTAGTTTTPAVPATAKRFDDVDITAEELQGVWYHKWEAGGRYNLPLEAELIFDGDRFIEVFHFLDDDTYNYMTGRYAVTSAPYEGDPTISHVTLDVNYGDCYGNGSDAHDGKIFDEGVTPPFKKLTRFSNRHDQEELNVNLAFPYDCFVYGMGKRVFTRADQPVVLADFEAASGIDTSEMTGVKEGKPGGDYYPVVDNALDYGSKALKYIHDHLKFPSTMEVVDIRHGVYNRNGFFDNGLEIMKPTNSVLSDNKDYYLVVLVIKAANSLGAMTTDTYVCLFDMDSGESWYDLEGYASDMADGAWGGYKSEYMDLESEALMLGAAIRFRSFTKEEVQAILATVTG